MLMERIVAADALLKACWARFPHICARICMPLQKRRCLMCADCTSDMLRKALGEVTEDYERVANEKLKKQMKRKTKEAKSARVTGGVSSEFDWEAGRK